MKKLVLIFLAIVFAHYVYGQNTLGTFLDQVYSTNPEIRQMKKEVEWDKLNNISELNLDDPEVSFDKLFLNGESYSEMTIAQAFEFPLVYATGIRQRQFKDSLSTWKLKVDELNILLDASEAFSEQHNLFMKWYHYKSFVDLWEKMMVNAKSQLDAGDITQMEYNRLQSAFFSLKNEYDNLLKDLSLKGIELAYFAGTTEKIKADTVFLKPQEIQFTNPELLDINTHPLFGYWSVLESLAKEEIKAQKLEYFPDIELGYRRDINGTEAFQGLHTAISIPVLNNRKKVKLSQIQLEYIQSRISGEKASLQKEMNQLLLDYQQSSESIKYWEESFSFKEAFMVLETALTARQISFHDFFDNYHTFWENMIQYQEQQAHLNRLIAKIYVLNKFR